MYDFWLETRPAFQNLAGNDLHQVFGKKIILHQRTYLGTQFSNDGWFEAIKYFD